MEEYLEVWPLLRVDWCIAVKVSYDYNVLIILSIYTLYECSNKLAFIGAFIEENELLPVPIFIIYKVQYLLILPVFM